MAEQTSISPTSTTHIRWNDIPIEPMSPQIGRQYLTGTNIMLARVLLQAGTHVPRHSHPNEQVAYILSGALRFIIQDHEAGDHEAGDREVIVRAGEVLCIPPNVPHEAFALEDTVDLDVFNPPRQDWIDGNDAYLRQPPASK